MSTYKANLNFPDFLAQKLHVGLTLRVYHVYTPAANCPPIFATVSGQEEEPTTCESHFLAISQQPANASANTSTLRNGPTPESLVKGEVLVYGIEVLIFNSPSLTTIFVSKADSTGFLERQSISTSVSTAQGSPSIVRIVTSTFLEWLVSQRLDLHNQNFNSTTQSSNNTIQGESEGLGDQNADSALPKPPQHNGIHDEDETKDVEESGSKRLVLSLFARSQNQYLFPGSIENATKHVLDDRQLIKWWCRVLDGLLQKDWTTKDLKKDIHIPALSKIDSGLGITTSEKENFRTHLHKPVSPNGFLIVPGCDRFETIRLFLPISAKSSTLYRSSRWSVSYPARKLNRCTPVNESSTPVRCMIPRLPDDPKARFCDDLDDSGVDDQKNWKAVKTLDQFWEMMSYRQECSAGRLVGFAWLLFDLPHNNSVRENGHSIKMSTSQTQDLQQQDTTLADSPVRAHAEGSSEVNTSTTMLEIDTTSNLTRPDSKQMVSNQKPIALSSEDYNKLADYLVNTTDFAGIEMAQTSTQGWIARVKELSSSVEFGVTVHGKASLPTTIEAFDKPKSPKPQDAAILAPNASRDMNVNILVGVRKRKRKVEIDENKDVLPHQPKYSSITTTDTGRPTESDQINDQDGAKTLAASLVRKKPKPAAS